jgi:hypothetical protein
MRLALHGPMYSGKTTLSRALVAAHGFTLVNYTDYLKELASRALSHIGMYTSVEQIKADKTHFRAFLQDLGTLLGFDEGAFVEQCLFEQAATVWTGPQEAALPERIVFDNVRTPAQFAILQRYGFHLVRLFIPTDEQVRRALEAGATIPELVRVGQHSIETPLPPQDGEIILDATLPTEVLADALLRRALAQPQAAA